MRKNTLPTILVLLIFWALGHTSPASAGEVAIPVGPYANIMYTAEVKSVKELREEGVTLQHLDYSCGSAALSTIMTSYLGQPYTEPEIIDFIVKHGDPSKLAVRRGFSLLDLKRFAEAHGVTAEGYQLDFDSLLELGRPVLVPFYRKDADMRHFVVFRGVVGDRVFLADPAIGRVTMFRSEFEELWSPKVGMVFSHPDAPPSAETALALKPDDELFISSDTLRAVALYTAFQYIHQATEY